MKTFILALALLLHSSQASAQTVKAVFNTPKFTGQINLNIETELVSMIDKAVAGSSVYFGIYDFTRLQIAQALLRANARGVRVLGVLDGDMKAELKTAGSAVHMLATTLQAGQLKFCSSSFGGGACRGSLNNHNKFMLFDRLSDGRTNVFTVTSANWNTSQFKNQNDLLVIANDAKLYAGALNYWNALTNSNLSVPLIIQGSSPAVAVYTFPNKQSDPVVDVLNQVTCELPGSKIRVMQSRFLDDRKAVAQRLAELSKQGCDVRVLTRDEPDKKSPGSQVSAMLGSLQTVIRYKGDGESGLPSIHTKMVAIDARINRSASKIALVLAGSHNMNGNSLRKNDELLARIVDRTTVEAYMRYWEETVAAAHAAKIVIR